MHKSRSNAPNPAKPLPLLPNLGNPRSDYRGLQKNRHRALFQIREVTTDSHLCARVRVILDQRGFDITHLKSIPPVADSLVYLVLCLPAPEIIRGVCIFYHSR